MNEIIALFIYEHKNTGEIKVRWMDDAEILEADEIWNHIGTVDPKSYINSMLREYPALVRMLKGGSV